MPFGGTPWNKGLTGFHRKPDEVLVKGRKSQAYILKRALLEIGRKYECEGLFEQKTTCSVKDTWNGKPVKLEIDHINGDGLDNRPTNLRFLCHNCHSQTVTFGNSKNGQRFRKMLKETQSRYKGKESERVEMFDIVLAQYYLGDFKPT